MADMLIHTVAIMFINYADPFSKTVGIIAHNVQYVIWLISVLPGLLRSVVLFLQVYICSSDADNTKKRLFVKR
jgi:hypothetical protein